MATKLGKSSNISRGIGTSSLASLAHNLTPCYINAERNGNDTYHMLRPNININPLWACASDDHLFCVLQMHSLLLLLLLLLKTAEQRTINDECTKFILFDYSMWQ